MLALVYIRFHRAMKVQDISRETLVWRGILQPYCAWFALVFSMVVCLFKGFPVFLKGKWNGANFVAAYISESHPSDESNATRFCGVPCPVYRVPPLQEIKGMCSASPRKTKLTMSDCSRGRRRPDIQHYQPVGHLRRAASEDVVPPLVARD